MTDTRPDPTRVVADVDVLAADLLVGGVARRALDCLRSHSWTTLVASDSLLDEAQGIVAGLADTDLAGAWRTRIDDTRRPVNHPPGDHPAVASALNGNAAHVLSFDDRLTSAAAGTALRGYGDVSVKHPDAFLTQFDPDRLYPALFDEPYPGPDRDPRA